MFSQVNDDFEDSPRTPTTQRSINQRPGDSSGPGDDCFQISPKKYVTCSGPLTSPDLPPTLWRTGRETKPRRIGINLQKNTIQVAPAKISLKSIVLFRRWPRVPRCKFGNTKLSVAYSRWTFKITESAEEILSRNFWNWSGFKSGRQRQTRRWLWNSWPRDSMGRWKALQVRVGIGKWEDTYKSSQASSTKEHIRSRTSRDSCTKPSKESRTQHKKGLSVHR